MIRNGDQMMTKRGSVAVSSLRSGQDARQDRPGLELSLLAREGDGSGFGCRPIAIGVRTGKPQTRFGVLLGTSVLIGVRTGVKLRNLDSRGRGVPPPLRRCCR
jgi:hypothetical protein